MSDELVEQVRAALDPTPASEADWPVSRRQVLRGLASVGALSLGPGAASGAAGTASADQAFFSNYGATSTADGWDVTIDGDVFAFDGDDTIGLPDGGTGTELVTPSGASASEVIDEDGNVVWEDPVPDSVVSRPQDDATGNTFTRPFGIQISVSQGWDQIQGELSDIIDSAISRAYVYRVSDGALMGDVAVSGNAGEIFTVDLDTALSAGETYNFVCDAEGASYNTTRYDSTSTPYTSGDGNLEIVAGADSQTQSLTNVFAIVTVGNINL